MRLSANPLLQRYGYSLLRPGQFWIYGLVFALVVGTILLVNGLLYFYGMNTFRNLTELGTALYVQFLILLAILLLVVGPVNTSNALQMEQMERSYDFFRLLPLSPGERAVGILVGRNLAMLPFSGLSAVLMVTAGGFGNISPRLQFQVLLALCTATAAANLTALLLSQRQRFPRGVVKTNQVSSAQSAIVLVAAVVGFAILGFAMRRNSMGATIQFYTVALPWLLVVAGLCLFVAGWTVAGVLRSFREESGPLFTRSGAVAFQVEYLIICAGLFWSSVQDALPVDAGAMLVGYGIVSCLPLLLLLVNASQTRQDYLDLAATDPGPPTLGRVWKHSNVGLWLGIFAIWAAAFAAFAAASQHTRLLLPLLQVCAITGAGFLFWIGLAELHILCAERNPKLTSLFAVFVLLQSALPLLLAAVLESERLVIFSPFGAWALLGDGPNSSIPIGVVLGAVLFHLLLGLAALVPLNREYRELARLARFTRETGLPVPTA